MGQVCRRLKFRIVLNDEAAHPMVVAAFHGFPSLGSLLIALGAAHAGHGVRRAVDAAKDRNPCGKLLRFDEHGPELANGIGAQATGKSRQQFFEIRQRNRKGFVFDLAGFNARFAQKLIGRDVSFGNRQCATKGLRQNARRRPAGIALPVQLAPREKVGCMSMLTPKYTGS